MAKKDYKKEFFKEMLSLIAYVITIVVLVFLIVTFVAQRTVVDGTSMEVTLSNGDNLIVEKISYRFNDPERFDVVVFPPKGEGKILYIKRIIGLPGETVWIDDNGDIYINGQVLEENYGKETILNPGLASSPITLGEDEYFVMGDNRNNSLDSRYEQVGNITRDEIKGKAWVRLYPFDSICFVKDIK